jgi:hypothetical protein
MRESISSRGSDAELDAFHREAQVLVEEIGDAVLDGTRKECLTDLATVPLLIIDDLGMRKLPATAAEDGHRGIRAGHRSLPRSEVVSVTYGTGNAS